jgi:hypothetical protein
VTWTVFIALLMLWLLGVVTSHTFAGLIHVLLLAALAIVLVNIMHGRRAGRTAPQPPERFS